MKITSKATTCLKNNGLVGIFVIGSHHMMVNDLKKRTPHITLN